MVNGTSGCPQAELHRGFPAHSIYRYFPIYSAHFLGVRYVIRMEINFYKNAYTHRLDKFHGHNGRYPPLVRASSSKFNKR